MATLDQAVACRRTRAHLPPEYIVGMLAVVMFGAAPHGGEVPAALAGFMMFAGYRVLWPRSELRMALTLSPANIALLLFAAQLVLVPLAGAFWGFDVGTLPGLPSWGATNVGLLLSAVAFASFVGGYDLAVRGVGRGAGRRGDTPRRVHATERRILWWVVLGFIGAGLAGLSLYFGSLGNFVAYVTGPLHATVILEEPSGHVLSNVGLVTRPFLGAGLVLAWGLYADRTGSGRHATVTLTMCVLVAGLAVVNFSYNRGTMLGPIVAVLAAYVRRVRRLSFGTVALSVAALALSIPWGVYRVSGLELADLVSIRAVRDLVEGFPLSAWLQAYLGAPQFTGFLVEKASPGGLRLGTTLVSSLLYPVPLVGQHFREASGVALYNRAIYGSLPVVDQVIPLQGELYLNFHVLGVVVGYGLLGAAIQRLELAFRRARSTFEAFGWAFAGLWTAFAVPGSLAVVSQMYTYFFWPFATYLVILRALRPRQSLT